MPKKPEEALEFLHGLKKLSKTELAFMNEIWNHPEGITSEELYSGFQQALGTKTTILHRISQKGYVEMEQRGRHYIYVPKITQLEYQQALIKQKLKKSFGTGRLETLIANFCGKEALTDKELEKVETFLEDLKNE